MIKSIFKFFHLDHNQNSSYTPEGRSFSFMLNKDGVGKSIKISAPNKTAAEQALRMKYPGFEITFLWEW